MNFLQVKKMLDKLYIDFPIDTKETDTLGGDIGLDSQEIVELKDMIEKSYAIRLTKSLSYVTSMQEISSEIQKAVRNILDREDTFYSVITKHSVDVNAPAADVFQYLWDYSNWPKFLPRVKETIPIWEEETFQEFYMTIKEDDKNEIKVRSIRRSESGQIIDFYQPSPPKGLKEHAGKWTLIEVDKNITKIELTHKSIPDYNACRMRYNTENRSEIDINVRNWLHVHGKNTLESWQKYLSSVLSHCQ